MKLLMSSGSVLPAIICLCFFSFTFSADAGVFPASGNYSHSYTDYTNIAEPGLSLERTFSSTSAKGGSGPLGLSGWTLPFLTEQLVISQQHTTTTDTFGPYYDYPEPDHLPVIHNKVRTYSWPGHAVISGTYGEKLALRSDTINTWTSLTDTKAVVTCVSPSQATSSRTPGPTDWGLISSNKVTGSCTAYQSFEKQVVKIAYFW